jgi:hypothetical protein
MSSSTGGGGGGSGFLGAIGATTGGGGSVFLVAGFLLALVCAGVLAIVLTGDDERAPRPDEDPTERSSDPRPVVEVRYGSPADSVVVRAWDRLTATVGAESSETPRETARRAAEAGFPRETVERLAESFRAVRYGDEPPEPRERIARDAIEAVDEVDRRRDTERGERR